MSFTKSKPDSRLSRDSRVNALSVLDANIPALASLPEDLILEIASFLEHRSDILHFGVSSSRIFSNIASALYNSVKLETTEQCVNTLNMLHRCPEIARHVQNLLVKPTGGMLTVLGDGNKACRALRQVARQMDALNTFVWDWEEGLMPHDDLWFVLRMSCPQLRTIGSSIGDRVPYNSHLFDFQNLVGFSLMFKAGFHRDRIGLPLVSTSATSRLWDMLIYRCLNLEELSIDGCSDLPIDVRRLVNGRWPHLRKLTLGEVMLDHLDPTSVTEKRPCIDFLEAHPKLQSLRISRHALTPAHLSSLSHSSFPDLVDFSGTLEQLQTIAPAPTHPHTHLYNPSRQLRSVGFSEPMLMRDVTPLAVSVALQGLKNLTTLRISFVLHSMYESGSLLRSLVGSCPRLERIEMECAHKPSFSMESFSRAMRHLPRLRSLTLTLVKFPGDNSLSTSAILLARGNPRLRQFTITFIPSSDTSRPLPRPLTSHPFAYLESGTYTLMTDQHWLPVSLFAVERAGQASSLGSHFGYGPEFSAVYALFGGGTDIRRYKVDLRPRSGLKGGLKGWAGLVMEKSQAGEELRMLAFMALLFWLSVWVFLAVGIEDSFSNTEVGR